jgi:hypothetical protein
VDRRCPKTLWEMFFQARESDGTLDSKDGMGKVQTLDCLLLLLLLLLVSPTREKCRHHNKVTYAQ